jgi:hypothetical protein
MNPERAREYNAEEQENRNFIERMKTNFEIFDIEPKLPIFEKERLENSDAKACFHYDEEREGDVVKMINKSYDRYHKKHSGRILKKIHIELCRLLTESS